MGVPAFVGQGFHALAIGTLASALLGYVPAQAQTDGNIESRIEATFDLVLGNNADLAIPLTRRALARRSVEEQGDDIVEPLPYQSTEAQGDADYDPSEDNAAAPLEQGTAGADTELARLPRPRPIVTSDASGIDELDVPVDLVAAAAAPMTKKPAPPPAEEPPRQLASAAAATASVAPAAPAEDPAAPAEEKPPAAEATPAAVLVPPTQSGADRNEMIAATSCLSVKDVTDEDGDFKRNAKVLSGSGFCITQEDFKERRRKWVVQIVKSRQAGPLWAVMHDDEDMSFDSAVKALRSYGGTLVAVETGGKRNLSGVDPNRNFSGGGIGCSKLGDDAAPQYTKLFHDLMQPGQSIIALHNNTGKRIPTGGLGHASMATVSKGMQPVAANDPKSPLAGEHSLVLLTSPVPVTTISEARAKALSAKGINAMIELVRDGKGDCSLSNYALLTDHPDYFNVTVDDGQAEKQTRIIDVLMSGRDETVASQ